MRRAWQPVADTEPLRDPLTLPSAAANGPARSGTTDTVEVPSAKEIQEHADQRLDSEVADAAPQPGQQDRTTGMDDAAVDGARLRDLYALARHHSGRMPATDLRARASAELTQALVELFRRGVSLAELARQTGCPRAVIRNRLVRAGVIETAPPAPGSEPKLPRAVRPTPRTVPADLATRLRQVWQEDPDRFDATLRAAWWAGWGQAQLGAAIGLSPGAVNARINSPAARYHRPAFEVPPGWVEIDPAMCRVDPAITATEAARMQHLYARAIHATKCLDPDEPRTVASAELDAMIADLRGRGLTLVTISRAFGAKPTVLSDRLLRRRARQPNDE